MRLQIANCQLQIGVALLVAALVPGMARAETIDRLLAVVAGQLIMLSDVTAATDLGLQSADGAADPVRAVLSKLIDREVLRVRQRFSSQTAFDSALARSGIDEPHLRETLRQDLRMRAYLDQRFSAAPDQRLNAINDWMAGLRRRGGVIDLYLAGR